jgi:biotin carboxyl carrier protein
VVVFEAMKMEHPVKAPAEGRVVVRAQRRRRRPARRRVGSSTRPDPQAKGLGEYLRSRLVDVPVGLLEQ